MGGLAVRFWGVRGSIACPESTHIGFGGNTSCLEVTAAGHTLVMDAGTGIRRLGDSLLSRNVRDATILLTHTHWDHINGFPFFAPAYDPTRNFRVLAGHLGDLGGVRAVLAGQMVEPNFPVPLETMRSGLQFEDFEAGDDVDVAPEIRVRTSALNHPNGATGYRVEFGGKSLCYVTDTEHRPGKPDESVLKLIAGADLVIYDSTYCDSEFEAKIGWGHSTWQEGVRLCQDADVKQLAIFHHDPSHDDDFMTQVEKDARKMWTGAFVAREGLLVEL